MGGIHAVYTGCRRLRGPLDRVASRLGPGWGAGTVALLLLTLNGQAWAAQPELEAPQRVVLGSVRHLDLALSSVPGEGALTVLVNVGRIESQRQQGQRVELRLRLPSQRSPQELLLMLHRAMGPVLLYRLPLLGRTRLPIRTRPYSELLLKLGDVEIRKKMGARRRRFIKLVVPPGVQKVAVQVTDRAGLTNEREVRIDRPAYQRVIATATPRSNSALAPAFHLVAAVAEPGEGRLTFEVLGPKDGGKPLAVAARQVAKGRWEASFKPNVTGPHRVRARLGRQVHEVQLDAAYVYVMARGTSRDPLHSQVKPRVATPRRWRATVAVGAGLLHNAGDLASPFFSLGAGAELLLGRAGSIGVRASVGLAWDSQQISGPGGLESARSNVLLAPLAIGPVYRGPHWPVVPYASLAFALSYVLTKTSASYAPETVSLQFAPGFAAIVGGEIPLGTFCPFLQFGYTHARASSGDISLLAGGIGLVGGVRLRL